MVNQAILVGRLYSNPSIFSGGEYCVEFKLTTTSVCTQKDKDYETEQVHEIYAYGKLGEICKKHLTIGCLVYVEGEISNGNIIARLVKFLEPPTKKSVSKKNDFVDSPDSGNPFV